MLRKFPTPEDVRKFLDDDTSQLNFYIQKIAEEIKEAVTTSTDKTICVAVVVPDAFRARLEKMALDAGWKDVSCGVAPVLNEKRKVEMQYTLFIKGEI